jgi:hypothetical protein
LNWEAIGAIGEVVGAIGVIATLGYLAVQIRQNTASVRAATLQHMSEASASLHDLLACNPELGRIFFAGARDLEALAPEERLRFGFTMMAFVRRVENIQRQSSQNRVSPEEWAGLRASSVAVMSQPGSRSWWAENSDRFNPGFVQWLEGEVGERAVQGPVAGADRRAEHGSGGGRGDGHP